MNTFFVPYFHFCLKLALESWPFSGGSWHWPHVLISKLSMVRALQPTNAPPDSKLPIVLEMVSLQGEGSGFLHCANKERNCPASTDQGHSTASQDSLHIMCIACRDYATHISLSFPSCYHKPIFKMDCGKGWHAAKIRWWIYVSFMVKGLRSHSIAHASEK